MPLPTRSASETGHRLSARPGSFEETQGPPGLLGHPLHAYRGATPHRTRPLLAPTSLREDLRRGRHRLREKRTLGIRNDIAFEATYPRPTRSRAYASPVSLPRPSPGSLPARASSPWPDGTRTRWTTNRNFMESSQVLQSQSTSRAWSHFPSYARSSSRATSYAVTGQCSAFFDRHRARCRPLTPSSKKASILVLADGRVKRSAAEWRKVFQACEASGLAAWSIS